MTEDKRNVGNQDMGTCNVGNQNMGDCNVGNRNTGDLNGGSWNTGNHNTGSRNVGNWNTGDCNKGHWNTGHSNDGDWNTGNWNTCDRSTGYFNTTTPEVINCFNKPCNLNMWYDAEKPAWLYQPQPTAWVASEDMTDDEKSKFPDHETTGGYLRENDIMEEWRKAYDSASDGDIQAVIDLPNFDVAVFKEITGLDLSQPTDRGAAPKEVIIDGVRYVRAGE